MRVAEERFTEDGKMSETSETGSGANFCAACGAPIHGGKFCSNCGSPSGVHQAITPQMAAAPLSGSEPHAADQPAAEPGNGHSALGGDGRFATPTETHTIVTGPFAAAPAPASKRGRGTWLAIGAVALAAVAVVLAVVLISSSGDSNKPPNAGTAYKRQVAAVFGPMLGANQQVSAALAAVRGTQPNEARLAVRQAQQATTAATGALGALTVPPGQQGLAGAGQQVLDREVAYLATVAAVLNHPTVAGASQLQTLSSNLTSALSAAGPTIAGQQQTVSGTDRLNSWAHTTSRTLQRRAAAKRTKARAKARSGSGSGSGAVAPVTNPYSNGNNCGDGVYAGPNTSCSFALNVRDAYNDAPGATASVRVYSPVTNRTYTMSCRPTGSGVTCAGANNASVTF